MDPIEIITIIATLVFLEGILSIDNAAVLGAMAARLDPNQLIPWPNFLKKYSSRLDKLLGNQRQAALKVGLLGAYLGRGLMLIFATWIIQNPWLKVLGALYLLKLSIEGLAVHPKISKKERALKEVTSSDFWTVVLAIELADLAFSLDNVVAAVAISSNLFMVMIGVAIGIVTMRFAAGIFTYLITLEPRLTRSAYILILIISVELLLENYWHFQLDHGVRFITSIFVIGFTFFYSQFLSKTIVSIFFNLTGNLFFYLNQLTNIFLVPVVWLSKQAARGTYRTSKGFALAVILAVRAIERRLSRDRV